MLKQITLTALNTILSCTLMAQAPTVHTICQLGGSGSENAGSVISTGSGYLVFAQTNSADGDMNANYGKTDFWLCALDNKGNKQWSRNYGGSENESAAVQHPLLQTNDGNFVFAGTTASPDSDVVGYHGKGDGWIVKVNATGNIIWQKTFGGAKGDAIYSIRELSNGDLAFIGSSYSTDGNFNTNHGANDAWVERIDKNGNLVWQTDIGGSSADVGIGITELPDGNLLIGGDARSSDGDFPNHLATGDDIFLAKLNGATGALVWVKTMGGTGSDEFMGLELAKDGKSVIAYAINWTTDGDFSYCAHNQDICLVNIDLAGNIIWKRSYGGSGLEVPKSIIQTDDGGLVIQASSDSHNGDIPQHNGDTTTENIWMAKIDATGNIQWQNVYGGTGGDFPADMIAMPSGNITALGLSGSTDKDLAGIPKKGSTDLWLYTFNSGTTTVDGISPSGNDVKLYPTLSHGSTNIEFANTHSNTQFAIVNVAGQPVNAFVTKESDKRYVINDLPIGLYIVHVRYDGYAQDFKVVVQ